MKGDVAATTKVCKADAVSWSFLAELHFQIRISGHFRIMPLASSIDQ